MKHRHGRRLQRGEAEKLQREIRSQERTCRLHKPFETAEAALEHYREQIHDGRADPGQEVYRCACGAWHHGGSGAPSLGRLLDEASAG